MTVDAPMLVIYTMGDTTLTPIKIVQDYTSISYTPKFDDVGSFSLIMPFSKEYLNLFLPENGLEKVLLIEDGIVGICQKISCDLGDKNETLKIQGSLGEAFLDNSILGISDYHVPADPEVPDPYTIQSHIQYTLSHSSLLSDTMWEALHFVPIQTDTSFIPNNDIMAGQSTFGEFIRTLCKACGKGYKVRLNSQTQKLDFSLVDYVDRGTTSDSPVIISKDFVALSSSKFALNTEAYKNMIYAWTDYELDGQTMHDVTRIDYDEYDKIPHTKKEIRADYVKIDITSEEQIQSMVEAHARLKANGKKALYDYAYVKSYDCYMHTKSSESIYNFGQDYFLGDILCVRDSRMNLTIDAKLLEYTQTYNVSGKYFDPTFGVSQPTLNTVLKKQKILR